MFPSIYDGQKAVHVFRDVVDVVGSMMRLKAVEGISWLDKYGRSILQCSDDEFKFSGKI